MVLGVPKPLKSITQSTTSAMNITRNNDQKVEYCHESFLGGGQNSKRLDSRDDADREIIANPEIIEIENIVVTIFLNLTMKSPAGVKRSETPVR